MDTNVGLGHNGVNPSDLDQDTFPSSPYHNAITGQQFFPHKPNANAHTNININKMAFDDSAGGDSINTDFRPDIGMFNDTAFSQNQLFSNPLGQVSAVEPPKAL